jgi:hypothetical protein
MDPIFQLSKQILLSPTNFFAPRTHLVNYEDPYSFGSTSGRYCSASQGSDDPTLIHLSPYSGSDIAHH